MFGLTKKKKTPKGRMVWMIQHIESEYLLGVCRSDLVHLKDPTACFRFADIDAAGVFLYWLKEIGKVKEGKYKVIYALVGDTDANKR